MAALEHRLEVKMKQKLILTPQLQQAIKLLQLPQLELSQMLNNELVENPFLEEAAEESPPEQDRNEVSEEEPYAPGAEDAEAPLERLMGFGSTDEYFDNRSYDGRDLGYFAPDVDTAATQSLEQYVSQGTDLYDHLNWQVRFSTAPEDVRAAAEVVIGNIDENGYLVASAEDVGRFAECPPETAEKAVRLVQTFDPPGVGARDLKECLLLQLRPLELEGTLVENLIRKNLPDIEKRRYQRLATEYGCSLEEIRGALKVIEGLEPKPGRGFSSGQPVYIKPDVFVVPDGEDFRIILNDDSIPNIRINSYYRKLLVQKNTLSREEKEYLNERLRSAVWLLKSLDQRNKTIYRVTESILKFQRDFFDKGVSQMKPLNLRDVAQDLDMHESTISRATSNKYLSCTHGLFGFRYFFSSGVRSDNGAGSVSSTSVKDMIRKIIGEEDPRKPLSDQKVSDMLKELNISVARRTVAKYRDELNIAAQNMRKKMD
ncbi:MAG: RNA polymerase factor sigma-54 [Nitrospirota bacterium]